MIRPFTVNDIQQLVKIARAAMPYPWSEAEFRDCFNENYYGWALTGNKSLDEIVGFIIILCHVDECELLNIAVKPDDQHSGLGAELLQYVFEFAKQKRIQRIVLEVRHSNQAAISFYKKHGFSEIGVRKNYYPTKHGREDALILARNIRASFWLPYFVF